VDEVEPLTAGALRVPVLSERMVVPDWLLAARALRVPVLSERMVVSDRLLMLGSGLASSALPPTIAWPTPPTTAPTAPTAPPTTPVFAPSSAFAAKGIASAATTAPAINMLFFIMRSSE